DAEQPQRDRRGGDGRSRGNPPAQNRGWRDGFREPERPAAALRPGQRGPRRPGGGPLALGRAPGRRTRRRRPPQPHHRVAPPAPPPPPSTRRAGTPAGPPPVPRRTRARCTRAGEAGPPLPGATPIPPLPGGGA